MKNTQVASARTGAYDGAFLSGLRVRVKELAQEAKYIRHEETKIRKTKVPEVNCGDIWEFCKLRSHRTVEVRNAARAAQLAYGFLRGVPYKVIEPKTYTDAYKMGQIKKEVKRLATKFGGLSYGKNYDEEVESWFNIG